MECLKAMNSQEVKAGTKVIMTHAERQAFLKQSSLGKLFGVSQALSEPKSEACNEESSNKVCAVRLVNHKLIRTHH